MRILLMGAGGVGGAAAAIAARRDFIESLVVADYDLNRARAVVDRVGDPRLCAIRLDATDEGGVTAALAEHGATALLNATDPRFVMPLFRAALAGRATYLDMAMSMSVPHRDAPYEKTGVKLGDDQFAMAQDWVDAGQLALVGIGVEPGLSDVFARYAADHLFSSIEELGVRDGADLTVRGHEFAPPFSIWTLIEECLNPPVVWERDRGWFTTPPFSEPEVFDFPAGIGPLECVNVEHEEVLLMPRWVDVRGRVTFKYGLGSTVIATLRTLHELGLSSTIPVTVPRADRHRADGHRADGHRADGHRADGPVAVSPRDVVAACLPDPATLGELMTGKTCAGLWVRGIGKDGGPREVYLYHVVDNAWSMRKYGSQAVVWQTAVNPVVALELIASGVWSGAGVLGPEAFDAVPFLDLLSAYGSPWEMREGG